ncbi:MAG TPA: ATP-binding protein [Mobilitalea sp.]|nr:ATP-binding protein [Mobilitalea sp.]
MKQSLKTQLSTTILTVVLLTIAIISFLANYFINQQFTAYIAKQQELKAQIITTSISEQYTAFTNQWNLDYIHAIGMSSLYEGYIIKVYDKDDNILWDAQSHDMNLCNRIMNEISERMKVKYPQLDGEFKATDYPLVQEDKAVGHVSISYFGPFFLNDNDFKFLHSLNTILLSVGFVSLLVSLIVGHMMAKRISLPILKTVEITKQIADGRYEARLEEGSNTKELVLLEDSINHLAVSLETLEKLRKQLTEDVAHELRTPITILQSYLEAMTEGVWDASPERLQSCYEEVIRIGKLVGDLESLAKLEGENLKLNKQRMDLYAVIDRTVQSFSAETADKGLQVALLGPHTELLADQDRIKQVIVNLFTNAVKYSKEGSSINIEVFETKDIAGFHISDTGIGISKEELPYIFERFYRADKSRNRSTGGTGIGLTIVKSIVEAHGGRVSVDSKLNEGSTFTVTLPKE